MINRLVRFNSNNILKYATNLKEANENILNYKKTKLLNYKEYVLKPEINKKLNASNFPIANKEIFNSLKPNTKVYDNLILNDFVNKKYNISELIKYKTKGFIKFLNNETLKNINIESNFLKYLVDLKSSLKFKNLDLNINYRDLDTEILEINHISGALIDRSYNPFIENIYLSNNEEVNGLIEYKLNNDFENYVNYFIRDFEKEVILRINILVKNISININEDKKSSKDINNSNHVITLESQLIKPSDEVFLYNEPIKEILKYYKLSELFVVDFDGIFNGNHLFHDVNTNNYLFK